jgi:hypothetical protein
MPPGLEPIMSMGKLREVVFSLLLLFNFPALSNTMTPQQIEGLMRTMNDTRVEFSLPAEDDEGGPK